MSIFARYQSRYEAAQEEEMTIQEYLELCRHDRSAFSSVAERMLDAIGDLYLLGYPLLTHFSAHKSGHALNNLLARELLAQPDAWEFVTFADAAEAPHGVARWLAAPAPSF